MMKGKEEHICIKILGFKNEDMVSKKGKPIYRLD